MALKDKINRFEGELRYLGYDYLSLLDEESHQPDDPWLQERKNRAEIHFLKIVNDLNELSKDELMDVFNRVYIHTHNREVVYKFQKEVLIRLRQKINCRSLFSNQELQDKETCCLCYNETDRDYLSEKCNSNHSYIVCNNCVRRICHEGNGLCPFCRKRIFY